MLYPLSYEGRSVVLPGPEPLAWLWSRAGWAACCTAVAAGSVSWS